MPNAMNLKSIYALSALLCLQLTVAWSQNQVDISQLEGFPESKIYVIDQDNQGFIWLCTDNGMVRFDGQIFTVFDGSDGMPNSDVYAMTADDKGRIWCHSKSDRAFYIQGDSVHVLPTKHKQVYPYNYRVAHGRVYSGLGRNIL